MKRHLYSGFFSRRYHGLEKISYVLPHLLQIVGAFAFERWQILKLDLLRVRERLQRLFRDLSIFIPINGIDHLIGLRIDQQLQIVIEAGITGASPPHGFVIALDRAVSVKVVLDYRQSTFSGSLNGSDVLLQILRAIRPAVAHAFRRVQHRVVRYASAIPGSLNRAANALYRPGTAPGGDSDAYQVSDTKLPYPFVSLRACAESRPTVVSSIRRRCCLCRFRFQVSSVAAASRPASAAIGDACSGIRRPEIRRQRSAAIAQCQCQLWGIGPFKNRPLPRRSGF